jgi:three-Cys-motif partner protein
MAELSDHDPKKWVYSEHTRAKHAIIDCYTGVWFLILGQAKQPYEVLTALDGFAGRGVYEGGELGSPHIIFDATPPGA